MSRFALVDCNNFYASCETLFRPDLRGKPLIVLSNNDGCVVARSPEAKALRIGMGVPFFQIREQVRDHDVAVFSSNYPLYADLSARVMQTLANLAPKIEVYSIDEAFLDLTGMEKNQLEDLGREIRNAIFRITGITTCVGMGPSKTLAKLANYAAKTYPATGGVVVLDEKTRQQRLMQITPVKEIWGVGARLTEKLNPLGIHTAWDLACSDPALLRKKCSVTLERTARELAGIPCMALEDVPDAGRKQMVCSRSFGTKITTFHALRGAVCEYTACVAEKLRRQGQKAGHITVFTSYRIRGCRQIRNVSASTALILVTDDTRILIKTAVHLLESLWRQGVAYTRAGIILSDFRCENEQGDLFASDGMSEKSRRLFSTIDHINRRYKGAIFPGNAGLRKQHRMQQTRKSSAYTTRWSDIPRVR